MQEDMSARYTKILVVEDDPTLRSVIVRNLEVRGHVVLEAETAADAAAQAKNEEPDLILLDINLPDISGWNVLRELRRDGKEIPTIVISAVRVTPDRLAEFKPLAYLPKPFPLDALLRTIETGRLEESGSTPG
jgi:DNA-binding response OmpR family regulator